MGTGHVMRCLALAGVLRDLGAEVVFVSRALPGDLRELTAGQGFPTITAPDRDPQTWMQELGAVDLLILDDYASHAETELACRKIAARVAVIDDKATNPHHADFLLNVNYDDGWQTRYDELVNPECQLLLGPRYALLGREYDEEQSLVQVRTSLRRVLICYGGSDPTGETERLLPHLVGLPFEFEVVRGPSFRASAAELRALCPSATVHDSPTCLARLMRTADLFVGASGGLTWERCRMGLPGIITAVAENQISLAEGSDAQGNAIYLGRGNEVLPEQIIQAIQSLQNEPEWLTKMSLRCLDMQNIGAPSTGKTGCQGVAEALLA